MSIYLERYAFPNQLIESKPKENLALVVTIPCYNEQSLLPCLHSLKNCQLPEGISIEVLVIINESENEAESISNVNQRCFEEAKLWTKDNSTPALSFYILHEKLPKKHAGVGLARKMIMDEATRRLDAAGKPNGVIVCFDADCTCADNYLTEIYNFFEHNPKSPGASIYFEHPLEGPFEECVYSAIVDYELFLRFYVNALRFADFPHAFETIGSSMAVRASAYQKQGGMNKRKAGEDFYFLHKIIPLGHFGEINATYVFPSPRKSDRVPFGTGRAVNQWLLENKLETYALETFVDLKAFNQLVPTIYEHSLKTIWKDLPQSMADFIDQYNLQSEIDKINAGSLPAFL
ncbi:glycosyltransferase family 2 protein, partial [Fulvivirga aurantia]|uniref:glycosyltransferase family 2 protein n=1 Tax=Fulvivirga aurantia TaxID=2529383 RepID=UPI001CA3EB27